jgi:acyl dehydratase
VSKEPRADQGESDRVSPTGWTGRCFEDFRVGDVYQHRPGRTITSADNVWFSLITVNANPLHVDRHYSARTAFGRPLVNSCFTLALVTGLSVPDVSQNAFANLGWDEVRLPHPVFEGDTIYAQSEVLQVRPSRSRPIVGIVQVKSIGYNQDGDVVIEFKRAIMVYRRGHVPEMPRPTVGSKAHQSDQEREESW